MRAFVHPSIEDVSVEGILHALSDPVRVAIFAGIVSAKCRRIANHRAPVAVVIKNIVCLAVGRTVEPVLQFILQTGLQTVE